MKRTLLALLPCVALGLASCGDSSYEIHQTFFYPQYPGGKIFYADQQQDTLRLLSLDSWTLSSTASWLTVTPTSATVEPGSSNSTRLTLVTEPNTTGAVRMAVVNVNAFSQISLPVIQTTWLNVIQPEPLYDNQVREYSSTYPTKATFVMELEPAAADTAVTFRVYQDNVTLSSDASWAKAEESAFSQGQHRVRVSVDANNGSDSRTATLTLTSAGISTPIIISQKGYK